LLLKGERMSDADLGDCVALLAMAKTQKLLVDLARVKARLDELDAAPDAPPGVLGRRAELRVAMAEVDSVVDHVVRWATLRADIRGLLLIGSHARGTAKPHSDVDLVLLCSEPARYVKNIAWTSDLGEVERVEREDWGKVHSVRVFYRMGREIEFGITSLDWASEPVDEGTLQVLRGGARVLLDPDGTLLRLMERP
jgi:predicted nucleotidyltransferase